MVGAPRSNRCGTCRKRRVKCDEGWPICGQCKRGNRFCPARPALKVIDDGAAVRRRLQAPSKGTPGYSHCVFTAVPSDITQPVFLVGASSGQSHEDGVIGDSMPLTPSERLSFAFVRSLQMDNRSYCLKVIGDFVWEMPRHFGRSSALDSVAACMLATHKQLLLGSDPSWRINPQLYSHALRCVQQALLDPQRWRSSDTLCATVLLHRLEAIFGTFPNPNIRTHAAGLAALHQKRGPPNPDDKLEFQVTVDSHLSIVQSALSERTDCFLASESWAAVLDGRNGRTDIQMIYYRLMRQMTIWPTLTRENSQLRKGDSTISLYAVLKRGRRVLKELSKIGHDMDELLKSQNIINIKPSTNQSDPVPNMFRVKDNLAALLMCHHAMYSIVVHRIVLSLLQRTADGHGEARGLSTEISYQCRRIWMLIDYSRSYNPLGLPIMQSALIFTYEWAENQAAQRSILATMNELDSFRMTNSSWVGERVIYHAKAFLGEDTQG